MHAAAAAAAAHTTVSDRIIDSSARARAEILSRVRL